MSEVNLCHNMNQVNTFRTKRCLQAIYGFNKTCSLEPGRSKWVNSKTTRARENGSSAQRYEKHCYISRNEITRTRIRSM